MPLLVGTRLSVTMYSAGTSLSVTGKLLASYAVSTIKGS